jgi:transposase
MNLSDAPQLAACIGIDWADSHHAVALQEVGESRIEKRAIAHTPEALAEWLAQLRQRWSGKPVGVCLETCRGPLVHALLEHDFIILYPVNPKTLKRFREAFSPSGAKDDPVDAELLLELLLKHRDRLQPWTPDDVATRKLARLTKDRRGAVHLRTKLTQQLGTELKSYFPQALDWTGQDLFAPMAIDFLLRWPTLEAVQRARPATIRKFYREHNCRRPRLIDERVEAIRHAKPLTTDPAVIEPAILKVRLLARQLQALTPSIGQYEAEIEALFEAHPDARLFDALPGAGQTLAPRLLTAFGTNRDRFASALEVQQYTGIAPVMERSGKQLRIHWRWSAPTFLRQSFHEFARLSIHHSSWARAYYDLQRERGKKHHAAVRSLAYKWIRILYRCWKNRTPYDEHRYIQALREKGSPLVQRLHVRAAA